LADFRQPSDEQRATSKARSRTLIAKRRSFCLLLSAYCPPPTSPNSFKKSIPRGCLVKCWLANLVKTRLSRATLSPHFPRAAQHGARHRNFARQIPHEMKPRRDRRVVKIAVTSRADPTQGAVRRAEAAVPPTDARQHTGSLPLPSRGRGPG
jgi:hypothetical protein